MRTLALIAVLLALVTAPLLGAELILDTGTPPTGGGSITSYVYDTRSVAMQVVPDQDFRVESASVYMKGRGLFVMLVTETSQITDFPDGGLPVSNGSFQRPDSWDWQDAWCDFDLLDFTMKKGVSYWFQYTNPFPETSSVWLGVRLVESQSLRRADWLGSSWQWPVGDYDYPSYVPGTRLYGYTVPEIPPLSCVASGLVCIRLATRLRARRR